MPTDPDDCAPHNGGGTPQAADRLLHRRTASDRASCAPSSTAPPPTTTASNGSSSLGSGTWYRHQALLQAGLADRHARARRRHRHRAGGARSGQAHRRRRAAGGRRRPQRRHDGEREIARGHRTCSKAGPKSLPVRDARFDFLSMGYALRHIGDFGAACREFFRVLKPGGRLCLLEITRPGSGDSAGCCSRPT
ncbi:MAG: class I SAM-dependent methyltransferase [Comamonadaceae bacterium]|nr:class I SAM-dependent methyltransferase [Comamonadaceae bacterium]